MQSPDTVEPPKIPADLGPPPPKVDPREKAFREGCPPHSELPYPPCWYIL